MVVQFRPILPRDGERSLSGNAKFGDVLHYCTVCPTVRQCCACTVSRSPCAVSADVLEQSLEKLFSTVLYPSAARYHTAMTMRRI